MKWKPRLDWRSGTRAALRTILLFAPLALVGLGIEALYPPVPPLLGLLEYVYYGVVGLFALHLVLDFTQAASKTVFFRITTLIILGGLGFTVISGLSEWRFWGKAQVPRLACHTRVVLATTGLLLAGGTLMFFVAEFSKGMADFSWTERVLASYFLAVTPRTAGFNTVDTASLTDLSLFITIILMFVGASPASTGGGVKTSTVALLVMSIRTILRQREEVEVFHRTIPRETVHKALVIITFSFSLINLFTILLLLTDDVRFLPAMFEVVSAFGTVGLSMGLTPSLTAAGKVIIIVVMFIGRIGPLTMALALGERRDRARFAYPTERVMVG